MFTPSPSAPARPGHEVLSEAAGYLGRFAVFPSDAARDAAVLWSAHTWVIDACNASARLAVRSIGPASGKTRVLELVSQLSSDPTLETDITAAALITMISQRNPTVFLDETDLIWGTHGGSSHKSLRAVCNAGYKRGATVTRRTGGAYTQDPIFGAMAFGLIGVLPDTLATRSIDIVMRKRRPEETIEAYHPRMHAPIGLAIGEALGSWARSVALDLASAWPTLPDGIEDRSGEIWEALIGLADLAGGEWPERGRAACTALVLGSESEPVLSPGQRILSDLRQCWHGDGNLQTPEIIRRLFALPGSPWESMWSPASAPRELAALLSSYGVRPARVRVGERVSQGYRRADLERVWPPLLAIAPAPEDTDPVDGDMPVSNLNLHAPHADVSAQVSEAGAVPVKVVQPKNTKASAPARRRVTASAVAAG